jgi:hypothetical protein
MGKLENLMVAVVRQPYIVVLVNMDAMRIAEESFAKGMDDFSAVPFHAHHRHIRATVKDKDMVVRIDAHAGRFSEFESGGYLRPTLHDLKAIWRSIDREGKWGSGKGKRGSEKGQSDSQRDCGVLYFHDAVSPRWCKSLRQVHSQNPDQLPPQNGGRYLVSFLHTSVCANNFLDLGLTALEKRDLGLGEILAMTISRERQQG